ncbi:stage III sporulation protein AF [Clostridium algifaecis]|uniref:Stage III sporulation protein AF n=1 Tax=Clostridium algifaecis TaxID=1472040 RepID=A0ABS4KN56_9CLOT|nr:stage III sporulation protein AF [Clostridium algifaecis]MBP2031472.1 stage III sporulation protein AF [Clostridium algifaecis]
MFLNALKSWLINICAAVFFITAIEMVLPDNSMKKYSKFVLGLILITVFIQPIVGLFNKNFNLSTYSQKIFNNFDEKQNIDELSKYKSQNLQNTIDTFKLNVQTNCEKKLKEKYPDRTYKVEVNANYDNENNNVNIDGVYVTVKNSSVDKVKKVVIDTKSVNYDNSNDSSGKVGADIKSYLSGELDVSENIIHVRDG